MIFQLLRSLLVISGTMLGVTLGYGAVSHVEGFLEDVENPGLKLAALLGCMGYLFGSMTGRELQLYIESNIDRTNSHDLACGGGGLLLGLIGANLLLVPVYIFVAWLGSDYLKFGNRYLDSIVPLLQLVLPLFFNLLFAYLGVRIAGRFRSTMWRNPHGRMPVAPKILDTSALIDGRIGELYTLGFLEGQLIVPRFVVSELHLLSDSEDSLKRAKGRQGLDKLTIMTREFPDQVVLSDQDFHEVVEVDSKLIALAKVTGAVLVTQDFNLKKIAELDKIKVLNLNDLMNALKPIFASGEDVEIKVIKVGKDPLQGVGYLSDGTMVVVEDGAEYLGKKVNTTVANILQTPAGRMIFSRVKPYRETPPGG